MFFIFILFYYLVRRNKTILYLDIDFSKIKIVNETYRKFLVPITLSNQPRSIALFRLGGLILIF